jgi:hypothetical protein
MRFLSEGRSRNRLAPSDRAIATVRCPHRAAFVSRIGDVTPPARRQRSSPRQSPFGFAQHDLDVTVAETTGKVAWRRATVPLHERIGSRVE